MTHTRKVKITGFLLLAIISIGVFVFTPLSAFWMHWSGSNARAASSLPYHEFADGPYAIKGNMIVGADNKQYLFHGVGRDSLEFDCNGDGFLDPTHLAYMGPNTGGPAGTYWYSNTVRINVSEYFWLHGNASQTNCTPANYQSVVKQTITNLTALKLNVILDLMWTDAGGQDTGSGAGYELPDSDSITFWSQAAAIYKGYSNVLFEVYNEPHPPTFACWAAGCAITLDNTNAAKYSYTGVSIQSLVTAIRGTGANNLALVAGIDWGYDLSQLSKYPISGTNIVYDSHPYAPYVEKNTPAEWDVAFGYLTKTYPVMSSEFGEYDGQSSWESMAVNYFDQHQMGWIAWSWYSTGGSNAQETGYPQLVSNYNGTPLANMGTYIYHQLLSYAGVSGSGVSGWREVPGNGFTVSGPATTSYNGNDYVFVRGTNDHLYSNSFNGTTWSGWSEVPGHMLTLSTPAAVSYIRATLYLFARGTDNKIYFNIFNGTSWSSWSQVPGNGSTLSGPSTAVFGAGVSASLSLFVHGTNDHLYVNTLNGTTWSGWSEVPGHGSTPSSPSAATYVVNNNQFMSLFVRGTNDHLYVNTFNGTTWSGWSEVPGNGSTPSAPAATRFDTGIGSTVKLFVRGTDNKIYLNTFNGTSWSGWSQVPGNGSTPDAPGASANSGDLYLFVRGTNDRIYLNLFHTVG
jgi:endoglucanase